MRTEDPEGSVATFCYDANDNQTVAAPPRASAAACTLDGTDGHSVKTLYDERDMVLQVVTKSDGKLSKSAYAYFDDGQLKGIQEPRKLRHILNLDGVRLPVPGQIEWRLTPGLRRKSDPVLERRAIRADRG